MDRDHEDDPSRRAQAVAARIRGCLLVGAVGDALGAAPEFLRLDEIQAGYGARGVRGLEPAYRRVGAITDGTQMTLFTAEGLLYGWRAGARSTT